MNQINQKNTNRAGVIKQLEVAKNEINTYKEKLENAENIISKLTDNNDLRQIENITFKLDENQNEISILKEENFNMKDIIENYENEANKSMESSKWLQIENERLSGNELKILNQHNMIIELKESNLKILNKHQQNEKDQEIKFNKLIKELNATNK